MKLIDHVAMPLSNVYEPLDKDFHRESSSEHDGESTLKERETLRNTNLIKNNNIQKHCKQKKTRTLHKRKMYRKSA